MKKTKPKMHSGKRLDPLSLYAAGTVGEVVSQNGTMLWNVPGIRGNSPVTAT